MATSSNMPGNGNNNGQGNGAPRNAQGFGVGVRVGWPTERWMGALIIAALATLILIRFGFRGVGVSGNVGGRVSL